jgi:signal transduction histidine kinase
MPSPVARRGCGEESPLGAVEVARLESQRRLALGAAHTLNNALTAALGEVAFLRDERKGDPAVVEACDAVARELERCVKAAAALLPRRRASGPGPTDLVRAARDAAALLRATLGRRGELDVRAPDDLLIVGADAADLDLLIVLLVQAAVERVGRSARVELSVEPRGDVGVRLALEARVAAAGELAHEAAVDGGDDPAARNQQIALEALAARAGGALRLEAPAPGHWRAHVDLPLARQA